MYLKIPVYPDAKQNNRLVLKIVDSVADNEQTSIIRRQADYIGQINRA